MRGTAGAALPNRRGTSARTGRGGGPARLLVRWLVGLSVFGAVLWYLAPSWDRLRSQVQITPPWLAVGLLGAALVHVAVAARWKLLSECTGGTRLSLWSYLHSLLATRFLGQFAPSLAMDLVGRGVALRSAGSERGIGHATTLVVLERVFDVVVPALLIVWALLVRQLGLEARAAELLLVAAALFLVLATPGFRPLARAALSLYGRLRRTGTDELPFDLTLRISFRVALLSVVRFACVVLQFAGIGAGIGLVLPWLDWVAATPVSQLTALIGFTPGSLGVQEAGWWAGLAWSGAPRERIALFLLAQRVAIVAFLGTLALLTWPVARRVALRLRASREGGAEHPPSVRERAH